MSRNPNINAEYIAHVLGEGKEFRNGDSNSWNTVCPAHTDKGPSLTVTDGRDNRLVVFCHAGCAQDKVIDALKRMDLWPSNSSAKPRREWIAQAMAPDTAPKITTMQHPRLGTASQIWEYRTLDDRLVGYIGRFEKDASGTAIKELAPLCWCRDASNGKEQWAWKGFPKPRPLYRGQILVQHPNAPILIVEGEKTADAAVPLFEDHLVLTWPGGSKAVKYVNWEALVGREVVIWPDADESGTKAAGQIAEILLSVGAKIVKLVDLPPGLPKGWDLADKVPDDQVMDVRSMVRNAPVYTAESGDVIDRYNKSFSMVLIGDKTVILWEKEGDDGIIDIQFVSPAAFTQIFGNEFVSLGRREEAAPKYWATHPRRRTHYGVVFEPLKKTYKDYNLWRGFAYDPDPDGDWSMLDEHIRENIAKGDESLYKWVLAWFAQIVQQPHIKPGTSLAVRGRQGTGKTVLGQHFGALYPQHYVYVDDPRYVTGQFNAHMASSLLLHADEAFFAGDPRHAGRLKGMVTAETNRIEKKGIDSFEVRNFQRLFISTNEGWVVPAGLEERRFAVLDAGLGKMQNRPYFKAMKEQLLNGGYEGLLHALQKYDLSTIDVGVIPITSALIEQKVHSLESVQRFWFEALLNGEILPGKFKGWPEAIPTDSLYAAYLDRATKWGDRRRVSEVQFGREIRELAPTGSMQRVRIQHKYVDAGGFSETVRAWGYQLPKLDQARTAFDAHLRATTDWPTDEAEPIELKDAIPF